jgi:hypothetical protein
MLITLISYTLKCGSSGNNGVGYLFARKKFGWDAPDWAYFITLVSAASVLGMMSIFCTFF